MSSLNPTIEEARAHKFLKAGKWTGKTLEATAADPAGRAYLDWWMATQPPGTETWRMITVFLASEAPPPPAPAADPVPPAPEKDPK